MCWNGIELMPEMQRFPYQIGYDAAGVVVEVGEGVTGFSVGDEIYTRLPEASRGKSECPLRPWRR